MVKSEINEMKNKGEEIIRYKKLIIRITNKTDICEKILEKRRAIPNKY